MADHMWRGDERRRWDQNADRMSSQRYGSGRSGWQDDNRFMGGRFDEDRRDWNRDDGNQWRSSQSDFGRESDYGAGYASPMFASRDLNRRPGGMRDDDWRYGSRYDAGFRNSPSDYQDYGDWQEGGYGYGFGPGWGNRRGNDVRTYGGYYDHGGRGYSADDRGYGSSCENDRNFWNKATDEVASWAGDPDATRRREMDHARHHAGRGPKGYTRSDDRIREDVNDRLTDDWRLDASNIEVTVTEGEVMLAGFVSSRDDKHRAEDMIENISGVKHVQNNLRVQENTEGFNQSASTPVGSSGAGTSLNNQNRPGSYSSSSSGTSSSGTGTQTGPNSTH